MTILDLAKKKNKISTVVFSFGTLISIGIGIILANRYEPPIQYIVALLSEVIVLIISYGVHSYEMNSKLIELIKEKDICIQAGLYALNSEDKNYEIRYKKLSQELKSLANGRYTLYSLTEVYKDDIRSIESMPKGRKLRSMCPVYGTGDDITVQLSDKSFVASIEAHFKAVERGVLVVRLYLFESKNAFDSNIICWEHLRALYDKGVDVRIIFLNDFRAKDARDLPHDFIVFDHSKVSVGVLGAAGTIQGAQVYSDENIIEEYLQNFEDLLTQSEKLSNLVRTKLTEEISLEGLNNVN